MDLPSWETGRSNNLKILGSRGLDDNDKVAAAVAETAAGPPAQGAAVLQGAASRNGSIEDRWQLEKNCYGALLLIKYKGGFFR